MTYKWEPGEIAIRVRNIAHTEKGRAGIGLRNIRIGENGLCWSRHTVAAHWHSTNGGWGRSLYDDDYRPLIVLDPEDEADVLRFYNAINDAHMATLLAVPSADLQRRRLDRLVKKPEPEPMRNCTSEVTINGDTWVCELAAGHMGRHTVGEVSPRRISWGE